MSFMCADTSMLIDGGMYLIQMRRDYVGDLWKFDVTAPGFLIVASDMNTGSGDFDTASTIIENFVRRIAD